MACNLSTMAAMHFEVFWRSVLIQHGIFHWISTQKALELWFWKKKEPASAQQQKFFKKR